MVHSRGLAGMLGAGGGAAGPMGGGTAVGGPGMSQSPVAPTNAVPGGSGSSDPMSGMGGKRKRIKASAPKRSGGNPFAKDSASSSSAASGDMRAPKNMMKRSTPKRF